MTAKQYVMEGPQGRAILEWQVENGKFSMTGRISGGSSGQNVEEVAALFPNDEIAQRMLAVWRDWHLNDTRAGTPAQEAWLKANPDTVRRAMNIGYKPISHYEAASAALSAAGLNPDPDYLHNDKPYRYGSAWLKENLPADIIAEIASWDTIASPPEKPGAEIEKLAAELGLSMAATFVPFSQSRNKDNKELSLNWRIALSKDGLEFLTTDYGAGIGHAPSYKQTFGRQTIHNAESQKALLAFEAERGKPAFYSENLGRVLMRANAKPIMPEFADVLHSLAADSNVLDFSSFEEWARDLGYDADSRKAESTYRACLDTALKLRNAIGEDGLRKLREACQDY